MTQQEFDLCQSRNKTRAAEISAALAEAPEEELDRLVREFIRCRFFLTEEELNTDDLLTLGDISTEKLARLKKGGLVFADKNAGCTTAPSSVIKKTLLAIVLGKAIGVKLDPDAVAYAETIGQLAELLARSRKKE